LKDDHFPSNVAPKFFLFPLADEFSMGKLAILDLFSSALCVKSAVTWSFAQKSGQTNWFQKMCREKNLKSVGFFVSAAQKNTSETVYQKM